MKYLDALKRTDSEIKEDQLAGRAAMAVADNQQRLAYLSKAIVVATQNFDAQITSANYSAVNVLEAKRDLDTLIQEKDDLLALQAEWFND